MTCPKADFTPLRREPHKKIKAVKFFLPSPLHYTLDLTAMGQYWILYVASRYPY